LEEKMKTHVELLAWLNIVSGALAILAGLIVFMILVGSGLISGDWRAMGILSIVAISITTLMFVLGAPSIVAGIGLLKRKEWARILTLILSCMAVFNFPVGTAIAVYAFWVLLNNETAPLFAAAS
jgi:hypothetical protein